MFCMARVLTWRICLARLVASSSVIGPAPEGSQGVAASPHTPT